METRLQKKLKTLREEGGAVDKNQPGSSAGGGVEIGAVGYNERSSQIMVRFQR